MIEHQALMLYFFRLQSCNLTQVGDTFPNLIKLSVEISITLLQFLNLDTLSFCQGSTRAAAAASSSIPGATTLLASTTRSFKSGGNTK
jgi:hypothetical protein